MPALRSQLHKYFANRRRARRFPVQHEARIVASASLLRSGTGATDAEDRSTILVGRIRDLSASGLSLRLPSISLSDRKIIEEHDDLLLVLGLPHGSISLQARVIYIRPDDERRPGEGFVVGLHVTNLSAGCREQLAEHLRGLGQGRA